MHDIFDLSGRTAIVTGASSGLGWRFAEVLHGAGANVVLAARRTERLEELASTLPRSLAVTCDVTVAEDRARLLREALDAYGQVDVLVNNAGVSGPSAPAESYPWERWEATIALNLTAVFGLCQIVGGEMVRRGSGVIVNVASILGLVAGAPMKEAGYNAAKAGVINLTRELGVEWARVGVRVNAIAPGWFATEMTAPMQGDPGSERYVQQGCPMRRMGEPHELDGALLFLASDASSYVTGHTLVVDGGWTAK